MSEGKEQSNANTQSAPVPVPVSDGGEAKSFTMPEVDLKSAIKVAVAKTNCMLSTLEERKNITSDLVGSRLRPLSAQLQRLAQAAVVKYEMRQYYGPQIIAGSAATVTALVSMRRGKIPGVIMGGLAGAGSYGAVYGELPDFEKK